MFQGFDGAPAPTGSWAGGACGCTNGAGSGAATSQSQFSRMQARKLPCLVRFSTINGAPHFGHGSAIGSNGVVKSQSG